MLTHEPSEKKGFKMTMTLKLNNDNGLQDWKKEHQAVTWCKRNSPAAGATQGYIRLHPAVMHKA